MKQIDIPAELARLMNVVAAGDFAEPTFRCRFCGDTGFVLRRDDHGREWGRRCDCLIREQEDHRLRRAVTGRKASSGGDIPF